MNTNLKRLFLYAVVLMLLAILLLPQPVAYAGDNDNRLNPDHAEYYTVYCANDNVDFYLANGTLVHRVLVARVMGLSSQGGSMGIGEGMTVSRWYDVITVSGYNGNAAPAGGNKTFSLRQCLDVNGNTPNAIYPGAGTSVPSTGTTSSSVTIPPAGTCIYVVKPGETVYAIAQRYDTTVYAISALNHLVPNRIYAGQHLTIPGCGTSGTSSVQASAAAPVQTSSGHIHVLLAGQTIYSVARAYHVSVAALLRANSITDPTRLPAGMVLQIP